MALLMSTPRIFPSSFSHSTTPLSTFVVKPRDPPPPPAPVLRRTAPVQQKPQSPVRSPQRTATASPAMGVHPFHGRVSRQLKTSAKENDQILSYHDVCLTREDITTLKDDWLTDNVIAFWEEYLEREYLAQYPRAKIVLLRPSMTFMLMQTPDPKTLISALPSFKSTTHIFLPITDCHNPNQAEGGTHWSLLLVSITDGVAFHYDSLNSSNAKDAALVSRKMSQLLGKPLKFIDLTDSPQQENGSDCGVFVCINMKHLLLKRLLKVQQGEKVSMSMGGRDLDARKGRKDILNIIEGFREEGERRRSSSGSPAPRKDGSKSPPRID